MSRPSQLDDPIGATIAWARYWRLMRLMAVFTAFCVVAALVVIYFTLDDVSIHIYLATGIAVGFSLMLMATLMGLVFLSSSSGHDESVEDFVADETDLK